MEKSRAIELLKLTVPIKALTQQEYADFVEAVNMGMDALAQPERTEERTETHACDLISRQDALDRAEGAIFNLPSAQPVATDTNVGDTISRQAVYDTLNNIQIPRNESWYCYYQQALTAVSKLPPVQPERAEGEWVQIQRCARDAQPDLECPFCKHRIGWWDMGRYCAGCGAKLKGGAG